MTDEDVLDNLHRVLGEIGTDGGLVTTSVYDTAMVLRSGVFPEHEQGIISWLLEQQLADGGFGLPWVPRARDLPTLAVVVALHPFRDTPRVRDTLAAARKFLAGQAAQWGDTLPDDIPVGLELILPWLLHEASALGIEVD